MGTKIPNYPTQEKNAIYKYKSSKTILRIEFQALARCLS